MTTRSAEFLMAVVTLLASLALMFDIYADGLKIGWVQGRGPGAGMWPFWLSLGMALASLATLVRWFQRATPESRSDEPFINPGSFPLVATSLLSLLALLIMFELIGTYFGIFIFMAFYLRIVGEHTWRTTMAMAFGTPIFIYLLFEVALTKYLPKGLSFFEELFLVVDNLRYSLFY